MRSAGLARLESLLQARKLDGTLTSAATRAEMAPAHRTGMASLDEALGGGWRQGEISEIVSRRSTGRTSLLVATLAEATRLGAIVGLVDAFDRFDPLSASRAGLDLERLLWVRGPSLTLEGLHTSNVNAHRGAGRRPAGARGPGVGDAVTEAVRRAVCALDLLLRAGGFAVAALDLGEVPARATGALPLTTWMRLAHAIEGRETVGLLLGDVSMGRSARGASVRLDATPAWSGTRAQSRRFRGFDVRAEISQARQTASALPRWTTSLPDSPTRHLANSPTRRLANS